MVNLAIFHVIGLCMSVFVLLFVSLDCELIHFSLFWSSIHLDFFNKTVSPPNLFHLLLFPSFSLSIYIPLSYFAGRTVISVPPTDLRVIKGTTAILVCNATHDPRVNIRYMFVTFSSLVFLGFTQYTQHRALVFLSVAALSGIVVVCRYFQPAGAVFLCDKAL